MRLFTLLLWGSAVAAALWGAHEGLGWAHWPLDAYGIAGLLFVLGSRLGAYAQLHG